MPSTNGHGAAPEGIGLLLRVSSEEQRERETITLQDEFLHEYCRLYGLEIAGIYADDGISGTIPLHERPEGRAACAVTAREQALRRRQAEPQVSPLWTHQV